MKNFLHHISYLGIDEKSGNLRHRTIILNNQINFLIILVFLVTLAVDHLILLNAGAQPTIGTYRLYLVILLCIINLFLASRKFFNVSKLITVLGIPVIFIILPTLLGFVEEESFVYYGFVLIVLSILPQILYLYNRDTFLLILTLFLYILLIVFIERMLEHFAAGTYDIIPVIDSFYPYLKTAQFVGFFFLHITVFYLRRINVKFEGELNEQNKVLDTQNEELRQTLDQLRHLQHQLIQSAKLSALGTLTKGVAHEVNNPLNFISGGLELLREACIEETRNKSEKTEEKEQAVGIIREGIERITSVVESLMTFSSLDSEEKKHVNIPELVDCTLSFLNWELPENIEFETDYQYASTIVGYPPRLHHALLAILENAIEEISLSESDQKQIIRISTHLELINQKKWSKIRIFNTGSMIREVDLPMIFDPFFTTKDPDRATGLGLTNAMNYVKQHGGSIAVANLDEGVEFVIWLPDE